MGGVCFKRTEEYDAVGAVEPGKFGQRLSSQSPSSKPGANGASGSCVLAPQEVMQKYLMLMSDADIMGEGTSSICRKGTVKATGEQVAIKIYKEKKGALGKQNSGAKRNSVDEINLKKFRRQIEVLQSLMEPLVEPDDPSLWCQSLAKLPASKIFMQLIDYSKGQDGEPGSDVSDGVMYVITELASYSLKDYIKNCRDDKKNLSKESVRALTKAMLTVTAGLHAKGLVHLDLKPENLMLFSGCMKLIDVDGCVKIGSVVHITDSSLSFSPCYCAPEWANFLIMDADEPKIDVSAALDVWSVGMTICEFVILDAALKPTYASFMRHGRSHREAGFLFMDWLSGLKKAPVPRKVDEFDPELAKLLSEHLLVCNPHTRKSCAEAISHPYCVKTSLKRSGSCPLTQIGADTLKLTGDSASNMPDVAPRSRRNRLEDNSADMHLHNGALWKLNTGGDAKDSAQWYRRDMWIAANGSLCYFSQKEERRLVLLDSKHVADAVVETIQHTGRPYAFVIKTKPEHEGPEGDDKLDEAIFAAENEGDFLMWLDALEKVRTELMRTIVMGGKFAEDFKVFRLAVKNRRIKVDENCMDLFEPVFKAKLAKVKGDGSRLKPEDWFERDMWLSKNGSLVYHSAKENRDLVYYTNSDVASAKLNLVPDSDSCRPWTFQVCLASKNGVEFTPGEFSAGSEELRDKWLQEFKKFMHTD